MQLGYIGGDAFYSLYKKHPEYEYSLLVRSEERAAPVKKAYPNVRIVVGSLHDADIIEKEAAAADIVVRMCVPGVSLLSPFRRLKHWAASVQKQ